MAIDLVGLSTSFVTTSVTLRISVLEWPGQGHARNPKVSIVTDLGHSRHSPVQLARYVCLGAIELHKLV